jgi:peptidyl-prolyl cis-trans isomerase B (cyclophilin B)
LARQRRRRRRGPAEYPGPRKTRLPFPINLIFNVKAFYVFFIVVMIASMAAVGLGVGSSSGGNEPAPIIDATPEPEATPDAMVFDSPAKVIDATQPHVATLTTDKGDIKVQLATDAPQAVNSFAFLAGKGFYDGTALFYVDPTIGAQGGDPTCSPTSEGQCTGVGGPGYTLPVEATQEGHVQWAIVAPMLSEGSGQVHGSQFRILYQPDDREEAKASETVFGKVIQGQEILDGLPPFVPCSIATVDQCDADFTNALVITDIVVEPA